MDRVHLYVVLDLDHIPVVKPDLTSSDNTQFKFLNYKAVYLFNGLQKLCTHETMCLLKAVCSKHSFSDYAPTCRGGGGWT